MQHNTETKIWNATLYLRLSRDDGDKKESNSITGQRALLRDFIRTRPELREYAVRIDDGFTGSNFERPSFKKMLEDVKAGRTNCIIVKDLSRFGRNYLDAGEYIEKIFPFLGVRFIAVNDNYDSLGGKNASDELIIPFKNLIKNISHSGKVSDDFSLFGRFCRINRCFRCSCGKFAIVHGVQAAIGFPAAAIGEKRDLPETHPVQPRTESKRPCRSTRAKPASKGFRQKLGDRCAVWDGEGAQLLVILNLCLSRLRLGQRLEGLPFLLSVALLVHVGVDRAISVVP